jgi:hypothetical protein
MTTATATTVSNTFVGLYEAVLGTAPPDPLLSLVNTFLGSANGSTLVGYINQFVETSVNHLSDSDLATLVLNNLLGKTPVNSSALHDAVTALLAANHADRGVVISQAATLLSGLENDPTFGAAAHAFNDRVHAVLVGHAGTTTVSGLL